MNTQDGRALFELQLELHGRAVGLPMKISADEILEVRELLASHTGDFRSLFGPALAN